MGIVVQVNSGFPQATECFRKLSVVWARALENVRKTGIIQRISVSWSAKLLTWLGAQLVACLWCPRVSGSPWILHNF
jgi:hypothetical protein